MTAPLFDHKFIYLPPCFSHAFLTCSQSPIRLFYVRQGFGQLACILSAVCMVYYNNAREKLTNIKM